jgi:nitrate reductase beta subunit
MNVRAQISTVFHLDKCIGCHTCSVACKNVWTDRPGAEYMWWNNVETKPGTGYPLLWEDQEKHRGGWVVKDGKLRPRLQGRKRALGNIFYNPKLPRIDDYYEPWTYTFEDLFNAPAGDDQPTARPISAITGKPMDIKYGPNWDDDLGGSQEYAAQDPNVGALTEEERRRLFSLERMIFFYLPRVCNHCLNPGCLATCPAGAIYKRGEDGIVLVSQEKCRGWRMCVSGCPYKKVYYNWMTGKSEKCILCYPRLEAGEAPACFHSCVGRIRYMGVLLFDSDRITEAAVSPDEKLVQAQRDIILDPFDDAVVRKAREDGVSASMIEAARASPVYRFVKTYGLALPLHPEFRVLPTLFYVPPLLPVVSSSTKEGVQDVSEDGLFTSLENARLPIRFFASLFSAGNEEVVTDVYRKLMAVRLYERAQKVKDMKPEDVSHALEVASVTPSQAEEIYRLSTLATVKERFVIPAMTGEDVAKRKASLGSDRAWTPKRRR